MVEATLPKLDLDAIPQTNATGYPPEYAGVVQDRWYRRLAPASGITDYGFTHCTLKPGAWSAQRHWHADEDEFVVMLTGEAVLVEEDGETVMRAGDIAVFPKGVANGHVLQNRGGSDCVFVAVGKPALSACHYPDIDMYLRSQDEGGGFVRKDGTAF